MQPPVASSVCVRRSVSSTAAAARWLLLACAIFLLCTTSLAQTTTISGTVFDPRTTPDSLPLPNVLVYATTAPVAPLPAGVQCLTYVAPTGVSSYGNTAVDGSFTLANVPVNTTYTLVIQAGKWRRQFVQTVGTSPITGLSLHMPADHTQGDIPMIAVATGHVDGVECVLRDMGIADTEFTDDTGSTNPGGHIHLYQGSGDGGAYITTNTPSEDALTGSGALLNTYDMVMFPCQGAPFPESAAAQQTIVNYANAGGRIFTTHYSYVWLDPNFQSQFPPVADWDPGQNAPQSGIATVNTGFTDGSTLAQWLQNAGATQPNTSDQIAVDTVRHDLNDVIPPTQSWLTLNDSADGYPVLQFTFNTPVGATAANQCGRVLFNEYHVINSDDTAVPYPGECSNGAAMTPQEQMLEYALFDLSAFVQPVIVPNVAIQFNPDPLQAKQGDTGDQVTVSINNTSANTAVDKATVLTLALPSLLTATAITDSTGGWQCTLNTLVCTRSAVLAAGASDAITLTFNTASSSSTGPPAASAITATVSNPIFSNNVTATDPVVLQQTPIITWPAPAPIVYGTALSSAQLNATSSVAGTFTYTPANGAILTAGQQTLKAAFTPTDTTNYVATTASVVLTVLPATPQLNLTASSNPAFIANPITLALSIPSPGAAATGTVTFFDGATQLGTAQLSSGTATVTSSSLAFGIHSLTASYSGDLNFRAGTSPAWNQNMVDFTLSVANDSSGSVTVDPGKAAVFQFNISPAGSNILPSALTLTAAGLPPQSSATFSPAQVGANSGATQVTLQVLPASLAQSKPYKRAAARRLAPFALSLIALPFTAFTRLRRGARLLLILCAAILMTFGMNACGGITYTPRSFSLSVTASAGALAHTTTVNVTVK